MKADLVGIESIGGTAFHVYRLSNGHTIKSPLELKEILRIVGGFEHGDQLGTEAEKTRGNAAVLGTGPAD